MKKDKVYLINCDAFNIYGNIESGLKEEACAYEVEIEHSKCEMLKD